MSDENPDLISKMISDCVFTQVILSILSVGMQNTLLCPTAQKLERLKHVAGKFSTFYDWHNEGSAYIGLPKQITVQMSPTRRDA